MDRVCQGCGKKMPGVRLPAVEHWYEYCGECNKRYMESLEMENKINEQVRQERWNKLVYKFGYDTACEIAADGEFY